ncbi:MAG: molybdopterin-binding protein [Acidobacteriota bacterium]
MYDTTSLGSGSGFRTIPVAQAVGCVLPHDITEIRKGEFKGRAFKKGHIVSAEDIDHLKRLGKENLFVMSLAEDDVHEDEAAHALARALAGSGVEAKGGPKEGKINLVATRDGLLRVRRDALFRFNELGEMMCATLHDGMIVTKGTVVAGTRAIPLVVKRRIVDEAVAIASSAGGVVEVCEMRKPRAGIVITGNEVYHGRIKDAFAPVITEKIEALGGEVAGIRYAPDDKEFIIESLRSLIGGGADLLITTGGMSVDPDDVTRFAIADLGARDLCYGSAVLPGAMFLVGYLPGSREGWTPETIPILGIPACGMYAKVTVFDLVLPRILAGEKIGRRELAELGHGGLCMKCKECSYPRCAFGKA